MLKHAIDNKKLQFNGIEYLDYDNIPEGRVFVEKRSALVFIPSFSYTRSF